MDNERKYKEALERAKKLYEKGTITESIGYIFPELKESEDEKIRKALIELVKYAKKNCLELLDKPFNVVSMDAMLAWLEKLEVFAKYGYGLYYFGNNGFTYVGNTTCDNVSWTQKQGEQKLPMEKEEDYNSIDPHFGKPVNKFEPKFKVGDWIVSKSGFAQQVLDFRYGTYTCTYSSFTTDCESNYHLWTIEDARKGDVLTGKIDGDSYIIIYKNYNDGWVETYGHWYGSIDRFCVPTQLFCRKTYLRAFKPATKEQCNLLFKKMKEEGYEWDADNKELIKESI